MFPPQITYCYQWKKKYSRRTLDGHLYKKVTLLLFESLHRNILTLSNRGLMNEVIFQTLGNSPENSDVTACFFFDLNTVYLRKMEFCSGSSHVKIHIFSKWSTQWFNILPCTTYVEDHVFIKTQITLSSGKNKSPQNRSLTYMMF